jgi:hypothetical protein
MITRSYEQEQGVSPCSTVQDRFRCSLTRKIMEDPVASKYGDNYERTIIMKWIKRRGDTCPLSGRPLKVSDVTPNCMLQWDIMLWKRKKNEQEDAMLDVSRRRTAPSRLQEPPRKVDAPPSIVSRSPEVTTRTQRRLSDTTPSVPRRKLSDFDLPSLRDFMAINHNSSHRKNIVTAMPMANVPMNISQFPSPLEGREIVFILDEVERSLIFDGF